ncbi:uncharacterized protein LOC106159995 [Lingula anatina]|uniref:Uncharacterized protein LOC106159995 n=1 Tax=Lingula anatina TaxID=7574 RepID=A0A1S3I100_LINAN|nr:uncharacterized protein LOC106159995 [Lingula anatina]|eukprot:XP_013391940.1 uncharacterized protein LOC106159995 [Lingula anatina]
MLPEPCANPEAIIPARTKFNPTTTTLCTGSPYRYLTRKRRGFPAPRDKGVFYGQACLPNCRYEVPDHESISSLCGLPFSRRRECAVPTGKMVVKDFDGGAPAPVEISHQFQTKYTNLLRSNTIT